MVELIETAKQEQYVEHSAPVLETAAVKPKIDLGKILTDAAMRHPKEVNDFLDEYIGGEGKELLISTIKNTHPGYAPVINKLFPVNGNGNGNGSHEKSEELDEKGNPLDDNDPEKEYDIPDTEILDEVRAFACSLHLSGYGWAAISDQIFAKYDIDWNPLKIKDIVLKNLAWNHRVQRATQGMPLEAPQKPQEQRKGIIRRFVSWLW